MIPVEGDDQMPRQKSFVTVIREMVRTEIAQAFQSLLGTPGKKTRRRRRRGPGRPPKRRGRRAKA
jgi:hypothetical protein